MNPPGHRSWFVTGTDTGVGKTLVACALMHALRRTGCSVAGMKPVAAGIQTIAGRETNEDVEALRNAASLEIDRPTINPYLLRAAVSPHIAANRESTEIGLAPILRAYSDIAARADSVIVEGCGGFVVPLAPGLDTADLAVALGLPVILVVGMRLGCLNHALLTQEAVARRGLDLAGWVANRIAPTMQCFDENLATLRERLASPLLGVVAHKPGADPADVATGLRLPSQSERIGRLGVEASQEKPR